MQDWLLLKNKVRRVAPVQVNYANPLLLKPPYKRISLPKATKVKKRTISRTKYSYSNATTNAVTVNDTLSRLPISSGK